MAEGHDCQKADEKPDPRLPRHVGHCGEPQYRWFADRLAKRRDEGWLRIGAVHHNQQRKCRDDEENLEDADDLKRILGPSLNLLLHGHTHEAELDWLDQRAPIVSTGSAALDAKARPPEIPNQYEVLQVSTRKLRRFGRAFQPGSKIFGPDPSVGKNDGLQEEEITFSQVNGAFRLWETATGKPLREFTGHQDYVRSVAFSPDGLALASGSADKTVRLWDIRSGECLAVLCSLPEGWAAFTPSGRYKFGGNLAGNFWHAIALCRFEAGELDDFIPGLRMALDEPIR